MILTVTMNPSVDISYRLNQLMLNNVNRAEEYEKTPGGKGLNVTRIIKQMQKPVLATGLVGGANGTFITEELLKDRIKHDFTFTNKNTRNCIAILHDGNQTEVLERGPFIEKSVQNDFLDKFSEIVKYAEVVVISGSVPNGVETNFYRTLLEEAEENQKVIVDASGELLQSVIRSEKKPFAIKPNESEICELLHVEVEEFEINAKDIVLNNVLLNEIPLILISRGSKGAYVKYYDDFYEVNIPTVSVVNPVGSGDATVAGISVSLLENKSIEEVMKCSMSLGILNAMEKKTGYVNLKEYENIYSSVKVVKL